jgi:hypothetical protein
MYWWVVWTFKDLDAIIAAVWMADWVNGCTFGLVYLWGRPC